MLSTAQHLPRPKLLISVIPSDWPRWLIAIRFRIARSRVEGPCAFLLVSLCQLRPDPPRSC